MYKKNIIAVFALVFLLGLFFQYSRSDGFVRLSANTNHHILQQYPQQTSMQEKKTLAKDNFLLIYDPASVQSMFLKHNLEKLIRNQKKDCFSVGVSQPIDLSSNPTGIVVATGDLDKIASLPEIAKYVENGGTALFMQRIVAGPKSEDFSEQLGIESLGPEVNTNGIDVLTNILFGAKDFSMEGPEYQTNANDVTLLNSVKIHMTSSDEIPLLWEQPDGKGKYVVYNGMSFDDKMNCGIITAMLSQTKAAYIYPIVGVKLFFIDDFPAPVPEGDFPKIYDELHLNTEDFFREVWWPTMLSNAAKYDIKYTGLVIESYGNQVKPPFEPLNGRKAKDNLIIYGRELLKSGGELGLHGYNHQSLAGPGYNQENLGYSVWESKQDMITSMKELRRYVSDVYPEYEFRVYVPPSNILSPDGKAAVKEAFPELKIYSSLYNGVAEERAYYQDFSRNEDGTYEIPRVTSGYIMTEGMQWEAMNVLNSVGIFSHFVHPDEIFYEESKDLTWKQMERGLDDLLSNLHDNYSWLRTCTASEGMEYMEDYLNMDYRVVESENKLIVYAWDYRGPIFFILRTEKNIEKTRGCDIKKIDENAYLIKVYEPQAEITMEGGKGL
jgi:hypothetical protein